MSWAALVKTTPSISTSQTSAPSKDIVSIPNPSCSQIRLASLKDLLDFRRSGTRKHGITYPPALLKSSISLNKFCQQYQDQLQWLFNQIILPSSASITPKVPSFPEFVALAWIFTSCARSAARHG
jgi:hypothetical protein